MVSGHVPESPCQMCYLQLQEVGDVIRDRVMGNKSYRCRNQNGNCLGPGSRDVTSLILDWLRDVGNTLNYDAFEPRTFWEFLVLTNL